MTKSEENFMFSAHGNKKPSAEHDCGRQKLDKLQKKLFSFSTAEVSILSIIIG